MNSSIAVEYSLRYSDYMLNTLRLIWFRPIRALGHLITLAIFPGSIVYLLLRYSGLGAGLNAQQLVVVLACSVLVASVGLTGLVAHVVLKADLKDGATRRLTLSPDRLEIASDNGSKHYEWNSINRVVETGRGFYLYRLGRPFWYLPKRPIALLADPRPLSELLRSKPEGGRVR